MSADEDKAIRTARYAKAIRDEIHMSLGSAARVARAVMALADEEIEVAEWQVRGTDA